MKRLLIAAAALAVPAVPAVLAVSAVLAGAASADAQDRRGRDGRSGSERNSYANPSAVIAAELAFAQAAQDKGQWTAFAEAAASDAVMFVPKMVYAQGWLKGRANPPQAVKWQPHEVWSSCDGSLVVSRGAWQKWDGQRPKSVGYFTTLWQRQKDGKYKWILDSGDVLKEAEPAPEMIAGHVADCPARGLRPTVAPVVRVGKGSTKALPPLDPKHRAGKSDDGSLTWEVTVDPSGARNLSVEWKKDGELSPVLIEEVAAEGN